MLSNKTRRKKMTGIENLLALLVSVSVILFFALGIFVWGWPFSLFEKEDLKNQCPKCSKTLDSRDIVVLYFPWISIRNIQTLASVFKANHLSFGSISICPKCKSAFHIKTCAKSEKRSICEFIYRQLLFKKV